MTSAHRYSWDQGIALIGPCTNAISIGTGATAGTITFPAGANTNHTREILIGGTTDGNIKVTFLATEAATSATIPVKAGQRYPWAVTKIWTLATGGVDNIWAFY